MSLAERVRGMVSRAVVSLVNDAYKMQALQVTLQADQTPDDAEHFQHYGLTSVPFPGAEGVALAVGGSSGHVVVINVDDRRYRIKALAAGEVCLYDDQGQRVHLTRAGMVIKGAGKPVTITDTPLVKIEANLQVTGSITGQNGMTVNGAIAATGDVTGGGTSLRTHVHGGIQPGAGNTGAPV